jgi:hypothetical protein
MAVPQEAGHDHGQAPKIRVQRLSEAAGRRNWGRYRLGQGSDGLAGPSGRNVMVGGDGFEPPALSV